MKPYMSIFVRCYVQLVLSTIRTNLNFIFIKLMNITFLYWAAFTSFFHNSMEVKTVLNLEADTRSLCKDTITDTQEVSQCDYQEVFYSVFSKMVEE
ncbi:MAG: hypothetical protein [Circular genetic element sp.]|nr:MAG: hypothetical protein [Circular genetic element sp.]